MTMNREKPHLYIIPEDRRDEELAVGFVDHHQVKDGCIKIVQPAGGWMRVLDTFRKEYIPNLRTYPASHVIMLVDFDKQIDERTALFNNDIPDEFKARVFVIGSSDEPETLKKVLKIGYQAIGGCLADDCAAGTTKFWDHDQLRHNEAERQRLVQIVRPFLFE